MLLITITVFACIITVFMSVSYDNSQIKIDCEAWVNNHVILAKDVHYYNKTFPFVKIDTLDDLNISTRCSPLEYKIENLKIFAKKNILLNNDLDLSGVLNLFNRSYIENDVVLFQNLNGFNENAYEVNNVELNGVLRVLQIMNVNFDFYRRGKLVTSENCTSENFGSKTSFFGSLKSLMLTANVLYNHRICPYVFANTNLEQLSLFDITNSLLFKNRLEFLNITDTKDFDMNIKNLNFLVLTIYFDTLTLTSLNPLTFKTLKALLIFGNLEHIEANLFENFKEMRFIALQSSELINFFHRGTKWLNSINRNLSVNLSKNSELSQNVYRLVSLEFSVQSCHLFNKYYTFPNEDICLFKNFPHSQLVIPLFIFDTI